MATIPKKAKQKTFNCIAMKRRAQARIYEEIKNLSPEEERAYFRQAAETGRLADWWKKIRRASRQ